MNLLPIVVLAVIGLPFSLAETPKPLPPTAKRDRDAIKKTLEQIYKKLEKPAADALTGERLEALQNLKAYRYLAGVPYENVVLDEEMNKATQAGAALCEKTKMLEHKPTNPGMPEEEFQLAYKGTSRSNLGMGFRSLKTAVDMWMDDSDGSNITEAGHRRWCLNPAMGKTGFGRSGVWTAMYSFDSSNRNHPDFDFVAWPPAGLTPLTHFKAHWVWTLSLNPRYYKAADAKTTTIKIWKLDAKGQKAEKPLELNHLSVSQIPFGTPNCVLFRPKQVSVTAGQKYRVEVEGLSDRMGQKRKVEYEVEFVKLN